LNNGMNVYKVLLSAARFCRVAMSADQSRPMFCVLSAVVVLPPVDPQTTLNARLGQTSTSTLRSGCLPFAWVQVLKIATLLLAVASAWAGVCSSGYDANWNDYFDEAKAKALAKVRPTSARRGS
jgi:hypothetical protein